MRKTIVSELMVTLLLLGMLTLAFSIQSIKAESRTWTVDDDGPADFAKIQDAINAASLGDTIFVYNGTYNECLNVDKTIKLLGSGADRTFIVSQPIGETTVTVNADNLTLSGFTITTNDLRIRLPPWPSALDVAGSYNTITQNILNYSVVGIYLTGSHNTVTENTIQDVLRGVILDSSFSTVSYNNVSASVGIANNGFNLSSVIVGNIVEYCRLGISLFRDVKLTIVNNTIANNFAGMELASVKDAFIYNNNFINNYDPYNESAHVRFDDYYGVSTAVWDNGYPSGGNYWSDYSGVDVKMGSSQDQLGSDEIGDTPYIINENNEDGYPLMVPWAPPTGVRDVAVLDVEPSATEVYMDSVIDINVTVRNNGDLTENRTVTVHYNSTLIGTESIIIAPEETTILTFNWDTEGVAPGKYTLQAFVNIVLFEANRTDNVFTDGIIGIKMLGDINYDGKVDIRDVAAAARAFGSYPDHPRWNHQADITGPTYLVPDQKIDIRDIALIAQNFGKTYP